MTKTDRKTRPLRRKTSHSVIERRRREKINEGLILLQHTVPACRQEVREMLDCKVKTNKKNVKRDAVELQREIDRLCSETDTSEMVLEKLCIISHTVDYVQELQAEVEAYRRWYRCSPPVLNKKPISRSNDESHHGDSFKANLSSPSLSTSEDDNSSNCNGCADLSRAKRHWGSNNPMKLERKSTFITPLPDNEDKKIGSKGISCRSQLGERHHDGRLCASQLYTNNITDQKVTSSSQSNNDRLELLAQVSEEKRREEPFRSDGIVTEHVCS